MFKHYVIFLIGGFNWATFALIPLNLFGLGFKMGVVLSFVAAILKGKKVHPDVSLVISPGSSKILAKMAENGALADIISSGARIIDLEQGSNQRRGGWSNRVWSWEAWGLDKAHRQGESLLEMGGLAGDPPASTRS